MKKQQKINDMDIVFCFRPGVCDGVFIGIPAGVFAGIPAKQHPAPLPPVSLRGERGKQHCKTSRTCRELIQVTQTWQRFQFFRHNSHKVPNSEAAHAEAASHRGPYFKAYF